MACRYCRWNRKSERKMTIKPLLGFLACAAVAAVSVAAADPGATTAPSAAEKFSNAETLLWLTDQLKTVQQPSVFKYQFEKTGTFEEGFTDTVEFKVEKLNGDGMKAGSVNFFTGERHFSVPASDSTNINPVLGVFLQGDVYEMNRLTDSNGSARERWRYFQRRIKFALAEEAEVKPITIEFDGKQWAAQEVTFQPYTKDPKRELFEKFADKSYSVIISEQLPGYLYRIQTRVPGEAPNGPPLIQETLQLVSVAPLAVPPAAKP